MTDTEESNVLWLRQYASSQSHCVQFGVGEKRNDNSDLPTHGMFQLSSFSQDRYLCDCFSFDNSIYESISLQGIFS